MFYRARRFLSRAWFNANCSSLRATSPLALNDSSLTLVSMVCHGETLMYLLAVKTFCSQLGRTPKVVVLDDGSLTVQDRALIQAHIPHVRIVSIAEITTDGCPTRSCWERLFLIGDLVKDSYVVQLDCDTLTLNPIPEVIACIDANRCFTLMGDRSYPEVEPMAAACARSKTNLDVQVQAVCERSFDQLPESDHLKYVRGNAGFTGFARESIDRQQIKRFSDLMLRLTKKQWNEWGSEQVTSNLLIANSSDPYPLQNPKYLSYWAHPDIDYTHSAFIHFIGPYRFANGFYLRSAKRLIKTLA